MSIKLYKKFKDIRTLTEAFWRACALGIRYDLLSDDPEIQAIREIHEITTKHMREKKKGLEHYLKSDVKHYDELLNKSKRLDLQQIDLTSLSVEYW